MLTPSRANPLCPLIPIKHSRHQNTHVPLCPLSGCWDILSNLLEQAVRRAGLEYPSISVHSQVPSTGWGRTSSRDWPSKTDPRQKSGKHFLPDPIERSTHHTQASGKQTHFNQSSFSFFLCKGEGGEGMPPTIGTNSKVQKKIFFSNNRVIAVDVSRGPRLEE